MIRIYALNKDGVVEERYLTASALPPGFKTALFSKLTADIVYFDLYTYLTTGTKEVKTAPDINHVDPSTLLQIWKTIMGFTPSSYTVVSDEIVEEFSSENDLVNWISSRL